MKLYSANLSNFATKCRIAAYDKGLNVEIAPIPGGGLKSPEYLKINPLGKMPSLELDDGSVILESEVINEYFEEKFPGSPLMPRSPEARANVRMLSRFNDLYLDPPMRSLFSQLNPKTRDEKFVNDRLSEINSRLDLLDKMLAEGGFAAGADFTLADCALAPTMVFVTGMLPSFGARPPLEGRPKISAWWTKVQTRPSVSKALEEMRQAMSAMMNRG